MQKTRPSGFLAALLPFFAIDVLAQAPVGAASSDTDITVWVFAGIIVFFVIVLFFTWRMLKGERARMDADEARRQK